MFRIGLVTSSPSRFFQELQIHGVEVIQSNDEEEEEEEEGHWVFLWLMISSPSHENVEFFFAENVFLFMSVESVRFDVT